jgi:hypothetical protein
MDRTTNPARIYRSPRLKVYGSVAELTLSVNTANQKNDPTQGQTNLKT